MARISNSVFKGHCYNVECHQWFDHADGRSSAMKARSLIWQLVGRAPVRVCLRLFTMLAFLYARTRVRAYTRITTRARTLLTHYALTQTRMLARAHPQLLGRRALLSAGFHKHDRGSSHLCSHTRVEEKPFMGSRCR